MLLPPDPCPLPTQRWHIFLVGSPLAIARGLERKAAGDIY